MQQVQARVSTPAGEKSEFGAYRLMTAEIVFGKDQPITLRDYDITPGFPRLRAFIERWRDDPEMRVRSVTVLQIDEAQIPACRISPPSLALH